MLQFEDILALNEGAVNLMTRGQLQEAGILLVRGIAAINEYSKWRDTTSNSSIVHIEKGRATGRPSLLIRHYVLPDTSIQRGTSQGNPMSFRPVMFFVNPAMSLSCSPEIFDDMVSSVMIYNLGLLHHRAALERGGRSRQLQHALHLYHMAQNIVRQLTCDFEPASVLMVISCANMAYIHAHFYDVSQLEVCIQTVLNVLASAGNQNEVLDELMGDFSFHATFYKNALRLAPAA